MIWASSLRTYQYPESTILEPKLSSRSSLLSATTKSSSSVCSNSDMFPENHNIYNPIPAVYLWNLLLVPSTPQNQEAQLSQKHSFDHIPKYDPVFPSQPKQAQRSDPSRFRLAPWKYHTVCNSGQVSDMSRVTVLIHTLERYTGSFIYNSNTNLTTDQLDFAAFTVQAAL